LTKAHKSCIITFMLNEVLDVATVIGTTAGYASGHLLEYRSGQTIENSRKALVPAHEEARAQEPDVEAVEQENPDAQPEAEHLNIIKRSRLTIYQAKIAVEHTVDRAKSSVGQALERKKNPRVKRLGGYVGRMALTSNLAIVGALTGFAAAEAATFETSFDQTQPTLAIAADHTASTIDGSVDKINTVADSFLGISPKVLSERTVVAHNGIGELIDLKNLVNDRPWGQNVSMSDAVNKAIGIASGSSANSNVKHSKPATQEFGSSKGQTNGVLILTDNDPIGDVKSENPEDVPLYIVDFGPYNETLHNDATSTGGVYVDASKTDLKSVVEQVRGDIKPNTVSEVSTEARWAFGVVGAGTALALRGRYRKRRKETVGEAATS
jgi:hypothetical protein